jgi:hypothetical protein
MTELLLRESIEIERQRDAFKSIDRINTVERDVAVLETRFEDAFDRFFKELERSVSAEDLKQLKREWEAALRDAMGGVPELVKSANDRQSESILGQMQAMMAHERQVAAEDQKNFRRQIFLALFTWGLGMIGGLFVLYLQTQS